MAKIMSLRSMNKLDKMKSNISGFNRYFRDNFDRFNSARKFTFESSLTRENLAVLNHEKKPPLEFNIGEAYLSRLLGEFSKQEPTLNVSSKSDKTDANLIYFLEKYLYQIIFDSNKDNLQYDVLSDTLSGGFSAVKVVDQYATPMSFDIESRIERFFDPTLCVFDKMARLSHKGDGKFSAELFPKLFDDVKNEYGNDIAQSIESAQQSFDGFDWTFSDDNNDKIVLLADYYEKTVKNVKIVKIAASIDQPEQTMTEKQYEIFAENWASTRIEQVPVVISSRKSDIELIDRYIISGGSIIDHKSTEWRNLPHVFFDGNSKILRQTNQGSSYQLTRPFLFHAQGVQQLKNYAGQCLANELQNMVQHKIMMCVESVLEQYSEALKDYQAPNLLLFSAYDQDDPSKQLPPPTPVVRAPIPPEIAQTFMLCDQTLQSILGSYDGALGINDNQLSGRAINAAANQSNPVALPFIVSYMKGWSQVGNILLERIKLNMSNRKTIKITDNKRKSVDIPINQRDGISLNYQPHDFEVNIEPGVSFEVQRSQAFQMIIQLMQTSSEFVDFMNNSGVGLETLLENVDIRGIDRLRQEVSNYLQEKKQKMAQMEQMQQQQAQQQMEMQAEQLKLMARPMDLKEQEIQLKAMKDAKEIEIKEDKVAIDYMKAESEIESQGIENALRASEVEARNFRSMVDLETRHHESKHDQAMDLLKIHDTRESLKSNGENE
jgi:hypothetical protein